MFFRQKRFGSRVSLQIVENQWINGWSRQRVIASVGRLGQLQQSGQLEDLLESGAKFPEKAMALTAHRKGRAPSVSDRRTGPALLFGRLWTEPQIPRVIDGLLAGRRFDVVESSYDDTTSAVDSRWSVNDMVNLGACRNGGESNLVDQPNLDSGLGAKHPSLT